MAKSEGGHVHLAKGVQAEHGKQFVLDEHSEGGEGVLSEAEKQAVRGIVASGRRFRKSK